MIRAFIFNLDGPLIRMHNLQAEAYARTAVQLGNDGVREDDVIEVLAGIWHLTRFEIIQELIQHFNLKDSALRQMDIYNVPTPWQAFAQLREDSYQTMLRDPLIILKNYCPQTLDLLIWARQEKNKIGLVSGLTYKQTYKAMHLLDISFEFDFVTSRDDVNFFKPDPEIYHLIADQLETTPADCLVVEDSEPGIKAALEAGMKCVCVTNRFNRKMMDGAAFPKKDLNFLKSSELKTQVARMVRHDNGQK